MACKEDKNNSSYKTDTQEQTKQKEYNTILYSMADGFNPYTIKTDVNRQLCMLLYDSLVKLTAALCKSYGLNPLTDVIRHYDVSGKECPVYYVNNENEWRYLLLQVISEME